MLGEQQVGRERHGGDEREDDAGRVQRHAAPDVHHHRQADEREREREPHAAADVLLEDEPRPEGDEQRAVYWMSSDADLEPGDGGEVEELDERDAADAEHGEEGELAAGRAQARGRVSSTIRPSPTSAPAQRACVRRSDVTPDSSTTFETVPLTANSTAAPITMR